MSDTVLGDLPGTVRPNWRPGLRGLLVMPVIGALVGCFSGAVMAYVSPKKYESVTVLQILLPLPAKGRDTASEPERSANYLATEFEVITSEETVKIAVERLDLESRWQKDGSTVVDIVQAITETERIRDADLVKIRVRHINATDARDIASMLAKTYIERRQTADLDRAQVELDALDADVRNQEKLVAEKRKVLETIGQAVGIPYVEGKQWDDRVDVPSEVYRAEQERVLAMEVEILQWEAKLGAVVKLTPEREAQLVQLDLMKSRAKAARSAVNRLWGSSAGLEVDRAVERFDFVDARWEYENVSLTLQEMKLKHSRSRIVLRIPRDRVFIHEEAETGQAPVSPNVTVMLVSGLLIGIGIGFLVGLLIYGMGCLRSRETPVAR